MAVKVKRPILVGGIGLSFLLWVLNSVQQSAAEFGETALLGTIVLGFGMWGFQRLFPQSSELTFAPKSVDREMAETAIAHTEAMIEQLVTEAQDHDTTLDDTGLLSRLKQQTEHLKTELEREQLRLGVMGGKLVGKTAVMTAIESDWVQQHPIESIIEIPDGQLQGLTSCDLVLFVAGGDVTDQEYQTLSQLISDTQRAVLVWNKQDQYLEDEQPVILQHLKETLNGVLSPEDVVAISASPSPVKVRQHQADGSITERMETQAPEISPLKERLTQVIQEEHQKLVWATTYRGARGLQAEVKTGLNQIRRTRALPIIEQSQWMAAAATFANPVPALDVLATAAINAQLVIDLGGIYQQKFSLQQAQEVAKTIGSQMLKLGLVELTSQTLTSILKSNTVTFVAGGVVQGVSAAYLTRIAGLSLIEYFQTQEINLDENGNSLLNLDALNQTLKTVFQQNQQISLVQSFAKQAVNRLSPQMTESKVTT